MLIFSACDDTYLDRFPKDQLTVETTFTVNSNFETYAWGFYGYFPGYSLTPVNSEWNSDLIVNPTCKWHPLNTCNTSG